MQSPVYRSYIFKFQVIGMRKTSGGQAFTRGAASLFSAGQNYTMAWLKARAARLEHGWSRSPLRRELTCKSRTQRLSASSVRVRCNKEERMGGLSICRPVHCPAVSPQSQPYLSQYGTLFQEDETFMMRDEDGGKMRIWGK